MLFEQLFNKDHLSEYFLKHLINRNGGGRDRMTPRQYWEREHIEEDLNCIINKCNNQSYEFSPYREILITKSRYKNPRCISIPTVRDRLVLGVLNEYLQEVFTEAVNHNTPNQLIQNVKVYISLNKGEEIRFFKSDFSQFYDNIRQPLLISKLRERIDDERIITLVSKAIQTPTISLGKSRKNVEESFVGVPQGLAISNILSFIYMLDTDELFSSLGADIYIRYVDDILMLNPHFDSMRDILKDYLREEKMGIILSPEKTLSGSLPNDSLDFLGFVLHKDVVSIRKSSIDRQLQRIANLCAELRKIIQDPASRPKLIDSEEELVAYYVELLNETISGIRFDSRMYGWLPYFQASNDLQVFFRMDKVVRKMTQKVEQLSSFHIHSFVKTYYDIIENSGKKYLIDYDAISDTPRRKAFLVRRGVINKDSQVTNEHIDQLFQNYCNNRRKSMEKNIGYFR